MDHGLCPSICLFTAFGMQSLLCSPVSCKQLYVKWRNKCERQPCKRRGQIAPRTCWAGVVVCSADKGSCRYVNCVKWDDKIYIAFASPSDTVSASASVVRCIPLARDAIILPITPSHSWMLRHVSSEVLIAPIIWLAMLQWTAASGQSLAVLASKRLTMTAVLCSVGRLLASATHTCIIQWSNRQIRFEIDRYLQTSSSSVTIKFSLWQHLLANVSVNK